MLLLENGGQKVEVISFVQKKFVDKKTEEEVPYFQLNYFPILADGTVSDEPERRNVVRDIANSFKDFKRGDVIAIRSGARVEPSQLRICDVKRV